MDRNQCDLVGLLLDDLLQSLADLQGMAISRGIDDKNPGHFRDEVPVLNSLVGDRLSPATSLLQWALALIMACLTS